MNKLAHYTVACLALAGAACGKKPPPLPAELTKIQCPTTETYAPGSHEVMLLAGATVALPCRKQGSLKVREKIFKETGRDPAFVPISFQKAPGGELVMGSFTVDPKPLAKNVRYLAEAVGQANPVRLPQMPPQSREIAIPTRPAFAATGAETTFICSPTFSPGQNCAAALQSKRLQWLVTVRFGWPYPKDLDVATELAEINRLVAAHIVSEE